MSLLVRNARLLDGRLVNLVAEDGRWTRVGEDALRIASGPKRGPVR